MATTWQKNPLKEEENLFDDAGDELFNDPFDFEVTWPKRCVEQPVKKEDVSKAKRLANQCARENPKKPNPEEFLEVIVLLWPHHREKAVELLKIFQHNFLGRAKLRMVKNALYTMKNIHIKNMIIYIMGRALNNHLSLLKRNYIEFFQQLYDDLAKLESHEMLPPEVVSTILLGRFKRIVGESLSHRTKPNAYPSKVNFYIVGQDIAADGLPSCFDTLGEVDIWGPGGNPPEGFNAKGFPIGEPLPDPLPSSPPGVGIADRELATS